MKLENQNSIHTHKIKVYIYRTSYNVISSEAWWIMELKYTIGHKTILYYDAIIVVLMVQIQVILSTVVREVQRLL